MKGLLLKDFYLSWRCCWAILVIAVAFLWVSFLMEDTLFFQAYPMMMLSSGIPLSLIGYDERDKWLAYSGTLPYSRAQLVSAKYLVGLCFGVVAFVVGMAATVVRMHLGGEFSWESLAVVGTTLLCLGYIAPALMLPFLFKFGIEKGRMAFYVSVGLCFGAAMVLARVEFQVPLLVNSLWPLAVVAGAAILLYALSWMLSIRFYQKREL